ncbi:MAG: TatD family hydrolase [Rikenellaceae bacterium]|nr:TatD family hydrolase [Rikenellaceae bacterium]
MELIDTHTHIYEPEFDEDRRQTMERAAEAGVGRLLFPAIDSGSHERMLAVCRDYPGRCLPMMGLHPTSVNDNPQWRRELDTVERMLAAPPVERFYGVGEIGLDLYWSADWEREQTEALHAQIELALKYGLPVAIHTRNAWPQMLEVLACYRGRGLRGVMHAFCDSEEHYRRVKRLGGFKFGLGGVTTYKKGGGAELVPRMELEDMVLETDSPYLPPVPFRGRRNESAYIPYICEHIARLKGVAAEAVAEATTRNAVELFGLEA